MGFCGAACASFNYQPQLIVLMTLTMLSTYGCSTLITSSQKGIATEQSQHCRSEAANTHSDMAAAQKSTIIPIKPSLRVAYQFSPVARRIAETIEVLSLLNALMDLPAPRSPLEVVIRRQQLTERIQLAILEVNSTAAEIICERDRADQLADRIDEVDGGRVKQLTIASIVLGGFAAIITGGIGLAAGASVAADASTLGGGALASWLGVSALFIQSKWNSVTSGTSFEKCGKTPTSRTFSHRFCGGISISHITIQQTRPAPACSMAGAKKDAWEKETRKTKNGGVSCSLARVVAIRPLACAVARRCWRRLRPPCALCMKMLRS